MHYSSPSHEEGCEKRCILAMRFECFGNTTTETFTLLETGEIYTIKAKKEEERNPNICVT